MPANTDPVRRALALLAALLAEDQPLHVRVEHADRVAELTIGPAAEPPPLVAPVPIEGKQFSPTEQAIMDVMTTVQGWITRAKIAERAGLPASSFFSTLLGNLAERGFLESGHRGFRLPPRNDQMVEQS